MLFDRGKYDRKPVCLDRYEKRQERASATERTPAKADTADKQAGQEAAWKDEVESRRLRAAGGDYCKQQALPMQQIVDIADSFCQSLTAGELQKELKKPKKIRKYPKGLVGGNVLEGNVDSAATSHFVPAGVAEQLLKDTTNVKGGEAETAGEGQKPGCQAQGHTPSYGQNRDWTE